VAGQRWGAFNGPEFKGLGFGQHGGWGPDETRPFLIVDHPAGKPVQRTERTSLIDIAPTILTFLGLPTDGMEGQAIAWV
jgi:arylsulfatase A-like enzyme